SPFLHVALATIQLHPFPTRRSSDLVPIFGVRGLNSGLADATNAAWKLAYVIRGWAREKLLDSYSPERRGATLDVFENAARSTRLDRKSTRLNSSHVKSSYAVFCLKK